MEVAAGVDEVDEVGRLEGFGEEDGTVGTGGKVEARGDIGAANEDDGESGVAAGNFTAEVDAGESGHNDIGDDKGEPAGSEAVDGLGGVGGFFHGVTFALKDAFEEDAHGAVVVDDEDVV